MDVSRIKRLSIVEELERRGLKGIHKGRHVSFKNPRTNEKTPSLIVDEAKNRFCNYSGEKNSGDIIDLVMYLDNIPFQDALKQLDGGISPDWTPPPPKPPPPPAVVIEDVSEITNKYLIDYASSRCIPYSTLRLFCKQLKVRFSKSGKCANVIGFKSTVGWEYRNELLKGCCGGKGFSIVGSGDEVILLEGFFDLMSLYQWRGNIDGLKCYVLNSTTTLPTMIPFLQGKNVRFMCDNDEAADKLLLPDKDGNNEFIEKCSVEDMRYLYKNFSDINEYWVSRNK